MKIRFLSSTEYSGFLTGLMRELNLQGIEAKQCFQISEASYRSAKSAPARLFLRFRQYIVYPVQLCCVLLGKRVRVFSSRHKSEAGIQTTINDQPLNHSTCDSVAVVSTNTFYAPLLATHLHPNVVHLVYDLFPEAMIHSGKWTEGTLKVKVVRWITKQTLKRAKTNVFLGERLKDYVGLIHGPVANAAIIAVGADQALFGRSPKERLGNTETLKAEILKKGPTILYCGNFGNMHDSETLFQYWRQLSRSDVLQPSTSGIDATMETTAEAHRYGNPLQWSFHCSGPKRAELEAVLSELPADFKKQIHLGGGLDQAEWIATMESADVALVTMVPGSETVVMPSKTYSAMMAGQAILAIAPEDSDLVDVIKAADCGWSVEPGDVAGLAKVIDAISADPEGLLEKRQRSYEYAHAHLGQDALAKQWLEVLTVT
ncbi:MAG: hypothetical protein P8R37_12855 [Opitutae bacterium]|nr:hypothetical protein [Opitutae bacterium]